MLPRLFRKNCSTRKTTLLSSSIFSKNYGAFSTKYFFEKIEKTTMLLLYLNKKNVSGVVVELSTWKVYKNFVISRYSLMQGSHIYTAVLWSIDWFLYLGRNDRAFSRDFLKQTFGRKKYTFTETPHQQCNLWSQVVIKLLLRTAAASFLQPASFL